MYNTDGHKTTHERRVRDPFSPAVSAIDCYNNAAAPVIVLAGGGTGGHIYPNLALLPDLKERGCRAVMIGAPDSMEERLAEVNGVPFRAIPAVKLIRSMRPSALVNNLKIPCLLSRSVKLAQEILQEISPAAVFSKGGFVSLPVALAALRLGIPCFAHESDATLGIANRIAVMRGAVCLAANPDAKFDAVFTGMPLRRELFALTKEEARAKLGISKNKKVLLFIGGSSGAAAVNDAVKRNIGELLKKYTVIHITGRGKSTGIAADGYTETEYTDDMAAYLKAADIVVSRAGATAVFEISALKKRALFIPLPKGISRGDQLDNAALAEKYGAQILHEEDGLCDNLLSFIERTVQNPPMCPVKNDANGKIVKLIDDSIRRGEKCKDKKPSPNGSS